MSKQVDQTEIRRIATMWAEIIRLQVSRLEEAVSRYHEALTAEQLRAAIRTESPTVRAELARQAPRSLTEHDVITVAADKYFLLLATAQLIKCVDKLPADGLPTLQDADLLKQLRNFEEHWEGPHGPAGTALRKLISDIEPGRLKYDQNHIWLEGVPAAELPVWAEDVNRRIRETLPDPDSTSP